MISNSWNKTEGETISQKVMGKVKPDEPLKNKIDFAQKKLQFQISLDGINEKLQKKHDFFVLNRFVTLDSVTGVTLDAVTLSEGKCEYLEPCTFDFDFNIVFLL